MEDGILQRIKNSLSSFHLHFILLRSANTSSTLTFFRQDKDPSPFDVLIVSNLFNNFVWPWVIAGNQGYWAYILSILADRWDGSYLLSWNLSIFVPNVMPVSEILGFCYSLFEMKYMWAIHKECPYAFKYRTLHCNNTKGCFNS